jgi:hypothetical protein
MSAIEIFIIALLILIIIAFIIALAYSEGYNDGYETAIGNWIDKIKNLINKLEEKQ